MLGDYYFHEDMPRERLLKYGADYLSDTELLAIILRTGSKKYGNVIELSGKLLKRFGGLNGLDRASIAEICSIKGIGRTKAIEIKAAIQIGKRLSSSKLLGKPLNQSSKVFEYLKGKFINETKEIFIAIILNNQLKPVKELTLTIGNNSYCPIDQIYIIKETIREGFTNLIIAHNHPSNEPEPSLDDIEFTQKLDKSCKLIGIKLLDHIIIGGNSYYSFAEKKLLTS
ncbi:MAG: DNA repair protein RadC [Deltaproteobacteria bacterium]|nr:DNA repair protein RadC [Deltaproteobacteria bacterium]